MSSEKRNYELGARARNQERTRRRIAAATAELHEEVGPARTTVAEIARRAGVQRPTVYNNFPDERDLFRACQAHFLADHPPPDPGEALGIEDPAARLRTVLTMFYGWYRETRRMAANVERDRGSLPRLDDVMRETADAARDGLADVLAAGFGARGAAARDVRALIGLGLGFMTWSHLVDEGLSDAVAARLMADAVRDRVGRSRA